MLLWLTGRDGVLLLDGRWFDSLSLHIEVSSAKILNLRTAPDVLVGTLHGSHCHQCINVCMNQSLWTKAKCLKYTQNYFFTLNKQFLGIRKLPVFSCNATLGTFLTVYVMFLWKTFLWGHLNTFPVSFFSPPTPQSKPKQIPTQHTLEHHFPFHRRLIQTFTVYLIYIWVTWCSSAVMKDDICDKCTDHKLSHHNRTCLLVTLRNPFPPPPVLFMLSPPSALNMAAALDAVARVHFDGS